MTKLGCLFIACTIALGGCVMDPGAVDNNDPDAVTQADLDFYKLSPAEIAVPDDILTTEQISPDTTTRGARAITWYKNHRGSTAYEEMCELAAEISFGTRGRYPSAIDDWNAQVHAGRAHPGDRTAPRGALVFWRTSSFGHVAVSDGNGGEWSTSVNHRIGHAKITYFANYLGWAYAPTSWPGR